MIARLGSVQFKERDAARKKLDDYGKRAIPALKNNLSLEERRRIAAMLDALHVATPPEILPIRAVEALERISGAQAREVLPAPSPAASRKPG